MAELNSIAELVNVQGVVLRRDYDEFKLAARYRRMGRAEAMTAAFKMFAQAVWNEMAKAKEQGNASQSSATL